MLQQLRCFGISHRAVAMLLWLPSVAVGGQEVRATAPTPSNAPIGSVTSNPVTCAYDQMPIEDREMALLLFEREVVSGVKIHSDSRNLKVIERLVDEARAKCSARYRWSNAQMEAVTAYAMNELIIVGVTQALEAQGPSSGIIDAYYTKHRNGLVGFEKIEGSNADEFHAYLLEQGWVKSEAVTPMLAEFYLEALLARDHQTQTFVAAGARPAAVKKSGVSRLPIQARTTKRGKP